MFCFACIAVPAIFFIVFSSAPAAAQGTYKETVQALRDQLPKYDVPLDKWKYRSKCDERCFAPQLEEKLSKLEWKTAAPGFYWNEANQVFWFRKEYTVPEQVAGQSTKGAKIVLTMNVSDGGEAYANGKEAGGVGDGAVITENATPGEKIVIGVKVHNGTWPGAYMGAKLSFSIFDDIKSKTLDYVNLVSDAEALPHVAQLDKWTATLNTSASKVDLAAFSNFDKQKYFKSLEAASAELDSLGWLFKDYTLFFTGYSHTDLAWLWDWKEGEDTTFRTLSTVFKLFGEYPDWIFAHSQAHSIEWMEKDKPEVFEKMKTYFKDGRLELVGGTWVEHDSNLPDGEGFAREYLYGKRYMREKFGKDVVIAWTPDSFGYNWNLPQIMKKAGMKGFVTQKLGSNETTRFPYKVFWWEGADGSRILTYFPPGGYANPAYRHELIGQLAGFKADHDMNDELVVFGVGDHGGGVTREHLNRINDMKNSKSAPNVVFTTVESYFNHLDDLSKTKNFPTWNDELYLEHHRGTYTSQANNKKNNRRCEQLLMDSEKFSSIAESLYGLPYPKDKLFASGWRLVLFNHFHDILPGSGINKVYRDSDVDYAQVYQATGEIIKDSSGSIASNIKGLDSPDASPLVIFNPVSWNRNAIIEYPINRNEYLDKYWRLYTDGNGGDIDYQFSDVGGESKLVFVAKDLPATGYRVVRLSGPLTPIRPGGEKSNSDLIIGDNYFENTFTKVSFDPKTGNLTSIFDKKLNREFLNEKGGNIVQAFKDTQNAWEIQAREPFEFEPAAGFEIIEKGPVRATFKVTRKIRNSSVTQYVSLYENDPLVYGRIDMDVADHEITYKLAFNLKLLNEDAWYEIPYAAISRKAQPKTPAEIAKFEVSAQKWVDYTDQDGSAGISLLNNSKYGFDVRDNVMRMTLLRTPIDPDENADQGHHSIEYALYTHAGDWRAADTSRKGYEFNYKPYVVSPDLSHENKNAALPVSFSFASAGPDDVVMTAFKKAEDGDGYVIRIVETEGRDTNAEITLPWPPKKVIECNLIEDTMPDGAKANIDGNRISFKMGKYEIKTFKLIR